MPGPWVIPDRVCVIQPDKKRTAVEHHRNRAGTVRHQLKPIRHRSGANTDIAERSKVVICHSVYRVRIGWRWSYLRIDRADLTPHDQVVKLGLRIGSRRVAQGTGAVDAYAFPLSVHQRLQLKHPDLQAEHITIIEGGLRQWFRIGESDSA
jgi:hypothetical protein